MNFIIFHSLTQKLTLLIENHKRKELLITCYHVYCHTTQNMPNLVRLIKCYHEYIIFYFFLDLSSSITAYMNELLQSQSSPPYEQRVSVFYICQVFCMYICGQISISHIQLKGRLVRFTLFFFFYSNESITSIVIYNIYIIYNIELYMRSVYIWDPGMRKCKKKE